MTFNIDKIKNKLDGLKDLKKINPHRHWSILLTFFVFSMLIFIVYGLWTFYKVRTRSLYKVDFQSESPVVFKEKLLRDINQSFEIKDSREKNLLIDPISYPDPSVLK